MTARPEGDGYGTRVARDTLDDKPRCSRCNKVLAWFVTRPWRIKCSRCGLDNAR